MFIHKLPYDVRKKLVDTLDAGDFWRDLGGRRLNYGYEDLNRFRQAVYRPGDSPADAMLTHWGQRNHTVTELFKHLYSLKHFQVGKRGRRFFELHTMLHIYFVTRD